MKIAIIPNLTREKAAEITVNISKELDLLNVQYCLPQMGNSPFDSLKNVQYMYMADMLQWCDVVIAVGGDGSFLNAAKKAVCYNKPILCINAGRLAFMAGLESNELILLKSIINGEYKMDRRMMLDVKIQREDEIIYDDFCINDVVISRGSKLRMTDINVDCDGKRINTYRGDGIIVATPTGSTAYSLTAGGPVMNPSIESMVMTPICTQSLFARSIVFDSKNIISMYANNDSRNSDLFLSLDGDESINIAKGEKIFVKKSDRYADFIRLKTDEFFDVLHTKLADRRV
ncbi:MAG: NAD(+)/NADH kinase [Oscillospiraceae bacterium]|jgi:NAD+ kinase|nr:NAD(+)/NADH kinase [Oscillospiraceae bacterium]